jgi:hypothetical protein
MLDVHIARRSEIANQVRALISVKGPRTSFQKSQMDSLLREADELESNIHDETERRRLGSFERFLRTGHEDRSLLSHSSGDLLRVC